MGITGIHYWVLNSLIILMAILQEEPVWRHEKRFVCIVFNWNSPFHFFSGFKISKIYSGHMPPLSCLHKISFFIYVSYFNIFFNWRCLMKQFLHIPRLWYQSEEVGIFLKSSGSWCRLCSMNLCKYLFCLVLICTTTRKKLILILSTTFLICWYWHLSTWENLFLNHTEGVFHRQCSLIQKQIHEAWCRNSGYTSDWTYLDVQFKKSSKKGP